MEKFVLLAIILLLTGCWTSDTPDTPSRLSTLHNYPILSAKDCPVEWRNYNEEQVKERAKKLHMRPVDYLHWVNNKRYKKITSEAKIQK